jgi:hypothetical protein
MDGQRVITELLNGLDLTTALGANVLICGQGFLQGNSQASWLD